MADQRPNVVFVFADDWGWGDLGCHGHPHVETPTVDSLAAAGTDFQQFEVNNPVCSPSRTAVMTGHYPARHGVHQHFHTHELNQRRGMPDWLDPDAVMLPRVLGETGYATGHFGKWHLTNSDCIEHAPHPREYGYDEYAGWNGPEPNLSPAQDEVFDAAVEFIHDHRDEPFFLNLWAHQTHTPHYPSEESMAAFEHLDEREQVYAAVVRDGDRGIGQVLDALEDCGLDEDTLVIFSSDNGPEARSRDEADRRMDDGDGYDRYYSVGRTGGLRGRKRSLFAGGVRTPFIARWPGEVPSGEVDETSVLSAVDLLPTFCAVAGASLPDGYEPDGENVLPALRGESRERSRPIFWEWRGTDGPVSGQVVGERGNPNWPRLGVRDGDWKLLLDDDGRAELYRQPADWGEETDVADEHPDVVDELTLLATDWRDSLPEEPPAHCIVDEESL